MSTRPDVERRLKAANMLPAGAGKPEAAWSTATLLDRIEEKAAAVEARPRPAPGPSRRPRRARLAAAAALAILAPAVVVGALLLGSSRSQDVSTTTPTTLGEPIQSDASEVPFYARIHAGEILHDELWAVIVFYRPPNCIPVNVNLLDQRNTTVSDCGPPTVVGISTWEHGPGIDAEPLATEYTGSGAVPVWLVPWPLLERVTDDGVLTRLDLLAMQTRVEATASTFHDRTGPDGFDLVGAGELADGEPFSFAVTSDGTVPRVSVDLPFDTELLTSEDLVGTWENWLHRFEFDPDGTLTITQIGSRENFGIAGWPTGTVSEATFGVASGVLTITEHTATYCGEVRGGVALDPAIDQTGQYFADIGQDGMLVFDGITSVCGRFPDEPDNAPLTDPLTRVE